MENLKIKELYYKENNDFKSEIMYSISLDTLEEKLLKIQDDEKTSNINKLTHSQVISKLTKFQNIIKDWEDSYISNNVFDGKTYKIVAIMDDGDTRKIIGRNRFPDGFSNFVELVSGE